MESKKETAVSIDPGKQDALPSAQGSKLEHDRRSARAVKHGSVWTNARSRAEISHSRQHTYGIAASW